MRYEIILSVRELESVSYKMAGYTETEVLCYDTARMIPFEAVKSSMLKTLRKLSHY